MELNLVVDEKMKYEWKIGFGKVPTGLEWILK
jgi:hypothetical protein